MNNAGVADIAPAFKQSTEDFERVVGVNLVAPFALARDVAAEMRNAGGGAIVNIASVAGLIPSAGSRTRATSPRRPGSSG